MSDEEMWGTPVKIERINYLVTERGFCLRAWNDELSRGVWLVCTPDAQCADEIFDAASDRGVGMVSAIGYVLSTDWLPIVTGHDLVAAMSTLELKLAQLPLGALSAGSRWSGAVLSALEHFSEVRRCGGQFNVLPGRLAGAAERADRDSLVDERP